MYNKTVALPFLSLRSINFVWVRGCNDPFTFFILNTKINARLPKVALLRAQPRLLHGILKDFGSISV